MAGWSAPGLQAVKVEWDDRWFEFEENGTSYLDYVKRVRIVLPDGSSHEFRKDDKAYCCYRLPTNDDCSDVSLAGTYLAVDGSGMRFEQSSGGNILYMPDGGRYYTTASPQVYIDRNGNKTTFDATTRMLTDTLGREIVVRAFILSDF